MPDVVSNTTPLQYLHQIGRLDQLDNAGFYLRSDVRMLVLRQAGELP